MTTATLDTNILPAPEILELAVAKGVSIAAVSVTGREATTPTFRPDLTGITCIAETAVFDEGRFDESVWAGEEDAQCLEEVLRIVASGSFPKADQRASLTRGQRSQLRDALIFCSHVRNRRDIFVTDDEDFIEYGRRAWLQARFSTRILSKDEFLSFLTNMKTGRNGSGANIKKRIEQWHGGQLLIVWLLLAVAAVVCFWLALLTSSFSANIDHRRKLAIRDSTARVELRGQGLRGTLDSMRAQGASELQLEYFIEKKGLQDTSFRAPTRGEVRKASLVQNLVSYPLAVIGLLCIPMGLVFTWVWLSGRRVEAIPRE